MKQRNCKHCAKPFSIEWPNSNQQHCSLDCSRESARKSRKNFYQRQPHKILEYGRSARKRKPDNRMARLRRRYPQLPSACQSCAEDRVLEIAHRPEFACKSVWRNIGNCAPHMIWVLCPTCHKLLDKGICSPEELGLDRHAQVA